MRILHTMLRVGDLQRSIDFYTKVLGMTLLRTSDNPEYQYTLAFVGYGSNPDHAELELTYNYGTTSSELGTADGHIAISAEDIVAACAWKLPASTWSLAMPAVRPWFSGPWRAGPPRPAGRTGPS